MKEKPQVVQLYNDNNRSGSTGSDGNLPLFAAEVGEVVEEGRVLVA